MFEWSDFIIAYAAIVALPWVYPIGTARDKGYCSVIGAIAFGLVFVVVYGLGRLFR